MKCPNCKYKHGWSNETLSHVEGKKGDFYELAINMQQRVPFDHHHEKEVYGCPECGAVFLDI